MRQRCLDRAAEADDEMHSWEEIFASTRLVL